MALTTRCASCSRLVKNPTPKTCPHCAGAVAGSAQRSNEPEVLAHNRRVEREVFRDDLVARREERRRSREVATEDGTVISAEQILGAKGKALTELIAAVEDVDVVRQALEAETRKNARTALEARLEALAPNEGDLEVVFMLRRAGTEDEWFTSLEGDGETGDVGDGLAFETEEAAEAAVDGREGIEVVEVHVDAQDEAE